MEGGLTIYLPVVNFLRYIWAKNYENWLRVDKVIAMKTVCSFLAHPVHGLVVWSPTGAKRALHFSAF